MVSSHSFPSKAGMPLDKYDNIRLTTIVEVLKILADPARQKELWSGPWPAARYSSIREDLEQFSDQEPVEWVLEVWKELGLSAEERDELIERFKAIDCYQIPEGYAPSVYDTIFADPQWGACVDAAKVALRLLTRGE